MTARPQRPRLDILGIGNAIVDVVAPVHEASCPAMTCTRGRWR